MGTTYFVDNEVVYAPVSIILLVVGHNGGKSRVIAREGLIPSVWLKPNCNPLDSASDLFRKLTGVLAKTNPAGLGWVPLFCAGVSLVDGVSAIVFTAAYDPGHSNPLIPGYKWTEITELSDNASLLLRSFAGRI